ncbi:hypothetical protein P4639_22475 [Priestia megaterium]|uniref:hypothetical protein n=1 Tax=Priestia megaterium TaxID=1404 RepID=UPI002E24E244|nr:hypothetical protein [Priestia megaterium]
MTIVEELRANKIAESLTPKAEELGIKFKIKYDMYNDEALVRIKSHKNDQDFAVYSADVIQDEFEIQTVRFTYPKHRL